MTKKLNWKTISIYFVLCITVYNILPTLFYYSNNLKETSNDKLAENTINSITNRLDNSKDCSQLIKSYCKQLSINPLKISEVKDCDTLLSVTFKTSLDANIFYENMSKIGDSIPLPLLQMQAIRGENNNQIFVLRKITNIFETKNDSSFSFSNRTSNYEEFIKITDSKYKLAKSILEKETEANNSLFTKIATNKHSDHELLSFIEKLNKNLNTYGSESSILTRFLNNTFNIENKTTGLTILEKKIIELICKKTHEYDLKPLLETIKNYQKSQEVDSSDSVNTDIRNLYVQSIYKDAESGILQIGLHADILKLLESNPNSTLVKTLNSNISNTLNILCNRLNGHLQNNGKEYSIDINNLSGTSGYLQVNLKSILSKEVNNCYKLINKLWNPLTTDLNAAYFPVLTSDDEKIKTIPFGLIVYSPMLDGSICKDANKASIYVIFKGFESIVQKLTSDKESQDYLNFENDLNNLKEILIKNGFQYSYAGEALGNRFKQDIIFEKPNCYQDLLDATKEKFHVDVENNTAILELSNLEQRILTKNKIDNEDHEDLIKWTDLAKNIAIHRSTSDKYTFVSPNKNLIIENLKLSFKKYFRGDERKIIKWGIDISGGKTVKLKLQDEQGKDVDKEADLKEISHRLQNRVNKLGVSEVIVRNEGKNISIDFPGSSGLSAAELIKSSSMSFHIVNEKYCGKNSPYSKDINIFLNAILSEALETNKTDIKGLNEIALIKLGFEETSNSFVPKNDYAKNLLDSGLKIYNSATMSLDSNVDEEISMLVPVKSEAGLSKIIIVFKNYALKGNNLQDIRTSFSGTEGHLLHFTVNNTAKDSSNKTYNPQDSFYCWTKLFGENGINNTEKASYSNNRGWRMAVLLNGQVISSPCLNAALRDGGTISGDFSQREIFHLASDLKAGSLGFTPYILSEENVHSSFIENVKIKAIIAAISGVVCIIIPMCWIYRFSGLIACLLLFVNLLITWAVLQNIGGTITFAGIAGIVLSLGMSIDANVLIFEQTREEYKKCINAKTAFLAGFKKTFVAILDSNITTIIAALVLLCFSSGPVKGFAVSLLVGVLASMFTSLFMTKVIFSNLYSKSKEKYLKFRNLFTNSLFNFIKFSKIWIPLAILTIIVGVVALYSGKSTILGMDFTGGYQLRIDVEENPDILIDKTHIQQIFIEAGIKENELSIREVGNKNSFQVHFSKNLSKQNRPFYNLVDNAQQTKCIDWVVNVLEHENIKIKNKEALNTSWSSMSSTFSSFMKKEAILGFSLALILVFIYLMIRFELHHTICAMAALFHDVALSISIVCLLHLKLKTLQIQMDTIGCLMIIIGYSLNNTIVIFDKFKESLSSNPQKDLITIGNIALNKTLGRTFMTSLTTVSSLIPLLFLCSGSIFNFSLIMCIGIIVGSCSSWFIVVPMLVKINKQKIFINNLFRSGKKH